MSGWDDLHQLGAVWPTTGTNTPTPISNTFGPREKNSEGYRYDWHRGIDIPCNEGDPIYAIADGEVRINGNHPSYQDGVYQLIHDINDEKVYSTYLHIINPVNFNNGDRVNKGDVIAGCGASKSGFFHLHFEMRLGGLNQENCVHPLSALPFETTSKGFSVDIHNVTSTEKGIYTVGCKVSTTKDQLYFQRLDITIQGMELINKVESGRDINPTFFDVNTNTLQYTHKSSQWPVPDCFYASEHPEKYTAHAHLDKEVFNGYHAIPGKFSSSDPNREYSLFMYITVTALDKSSAPPSDSICVTAIAQSVVLRDLGVALSTFTTHGCDQGDTLTPDTDTALPTLVPEYSSGVTWQPIHVIALLMMLVSLF